MSIIVNVKCKEVISICCGLICSFYGSKRNSNLPCFHAFLPPVLYKKKSSSLTPIYTPININLHSLNCRPAHQSPPLAFHHTRNSRRGPPTSKKQQDQRTSTPAGARRPTVLFVRNSGSRIEGHQQKGHLCS